MHALVLSIRKSPQNVHAHFWKSQFCSKQSWCCLLALHTKLFGRKLIALCFEYVNWWGSLMKVPKLIALLILVFSINDTVYSYLCNTALLPQRMLNCSLLSVRLKQILGCTLFQKCRASLWTKWICKCISGHSNRPEAKHWAGDFLLEQCKTLL